MPITGINMVGDDRASVTFSQHRSDTDKQVNYTMTQHGDGSIEIEANGVSIASLCDDGYLRRSEHVDDHANVRRTPDGRYAMPGRRRD